MKPEPIEVFHVGRGELGDTESLQAEEGGAGVVNPPAGDPGRCGLLPEVGVDFLMFASIESIEDGVHGSGAGELRIGIAP